MGSQETFSHVTFLGTASACPVADSRNVSSLAITTSGGDVFLVDCGEGTQHQMQRCSMVRRDRISHIFITHLHGDHSFGIFGLLASMNTQGRDKPVTVTGPVGIKALVEGVMGKCESDEGEEAIPTEDGKPTSDGKDPQPFRIKFRELAAPESIDLGSIDGFRVSAHPLKHRVPTYGYVFEEPTRLGTLDGKKARALGARGKELAKLKSGEDVQLADGSIIRSADVVGEPLKGRRIGILQDTCDSTLAEPALYDAEMVIHECTYHDALAEKAVMWGHSTSRMAGKFAKKVRAKMLVLTHFSARYRSAGEEIDSKGEEPGDPAMTTRYLVNEAQEQCPDTIVQEACDFMVLRSSKGTKGKGAPFVPDRKLALRESYLGRLHARQHGGSLAVALGDASPSPSKSAVVDARSKSPCSSKNKTGKKKKQPHAKDAASRPSESLKKTLQASLSSSADPEIEDAESSRMMDDDEQPSKRRRSD